MRLLRYKVTNFRSVADSGWIDTDDVTAFIGVNESGKSNLLLPLWKLNPAREGDIRPTSDYPKTRFGEIRQNPENFAFISAEFSTGSLASRLASLTGMTAEEAEVVRVTRYYDGGYAVEFPRHSHPEDVSPNDIENLVRTGMSEIDGMTPLRTEEESKKLLIAGLQELLLNLPERRLSATDLEALSGQLRALTPDNPAKSSSIFPRLERIAREIDGLARELSKPAPGEVDAVFKSVVNRIPKFVYYSNYGNLDSEIYLPHVVQNLEREDLGEKEAAKARTLRVLFSFVRLKPGEILELGKDEISITGAGRHPTQEEIEQVAERKRERSILLQSAGTTLTEKFKEWWKQGDYRFRFEADGNHFRIWVADERRPAEVELEGRSTGLQWFLSFYLVFLVESEEGEHQNAVLLLDEPGLSLHPLAQHDLSEFFDNLATTNQIIYTTHSPFLVHADRLDRARKVYVDDKGTTQATADLRQGSEKQRGASYAVSSALGLSVAESLLIGCEPVIVEGASDQHYLTAIKTLLVSSGRIKPSREFVFPPAGGTKNTKMVAGILTGRDDQLPFIVLDGDAPGKRVAKELSSELYAGATDRLISIDEYTGVTGSEVEDLIPHEVVGAAVDRLYRTAENPFSEKMQAGQPIIGQIETWAQQEQLELEVGWKVALAMRVKQALLDKGPADIPEDYATRWERLFTRMIAGS